MEGLMNISKKLLFTLVIAFGCQMAQPLLATDASKNIFSRFWATAWSDRSGLYQGTVAGILAVLAIIYIGQQEKLKEKNQLQLFKKQLKKQIEELEDAFWDWAREVMHGRKSELFERAMSKYKQVTEELRKFIVDNKECRDKLLSKENDNLFKQKMTLLNKTYLEAIANITMYTPETERLIDACNKDILTIIKTNQPSNLYESVLQELQPLSSREENEESNGSNEQSDATESCAENTERESSSDEETEQQPEVENEVVVESAPKRPFFPAFQRSPSRNLIDTTEDD